METKHLIWAALLLGCGIFVVAFFNKSDNEETVRDPEIVDVFPYTPPEEPEVKPEPEKPKWPERTSFEGTWKTDERRRLDGKLLCDAHLLEDGKWEGKFYGDWRGMRFSYDVEWEGPPEAVKGKATIDGVPYTWKGKMTEDRFTGDFESNRYIGSFDMKRKKK